jgi:DNA-binding IclR family transcriptional regulator
MRTAGKLRMAAMPECDAQQLVTRHRLERLGPKSVTDPHAYLAEIASVRSTGYAVNDEETDAGVRFVASRPCSTAPRVESPRSLRNSHPVR